MTPAEMDFSTLSNTEMIPLLDLPDELDGLRYYIPQAMKLEMLQGCTAERRSEIIAEGQAKRNEHHAYLRQRRASGPIDKEAAIAAKMSGAAWRYIDHVKLDGGFRDDCTGRKGKVAYTLENVSDGKRIKVIRGTVDHAAATLRNVQNWPPPRGRRPAREAAAAGVVTMASLK